MKKLTIVLVTILTASTCLAQTKSDSTYHKAISFSFNGLNLNKFRGGIGGKYWTSESRAITVSILFGYDTRKTEQDSNIEGYIYDTERSSFNLGAFIGYEFHMRKNDNFSPYFGFGVSFRYDKSDSFYKTIIKSEPGDQLIEMDSNTKQYFRSLELSFGVEYWISKRISLAGNQNLTVTSISGKRKTRSGGHVYDFDDSGFTAGFGTSSLILSIYF